MSLKGRKIAVIGGSECPEEMYQEAYLLGKFLAESGAVVYTGGKGGIMEAACKGAWENGGITVGILPEDHLAFMNPYVMIPVATGMGIARNAILIHTADAIVAVDGRYGTLSEVAFALQMGKPIISLNSWQVDPRIISADSASQAVEMLKKMLSE